MSGRRTQTSDSTAHITDLLLKMSDEISRNGMPRGSSVKVIKKACKHIRTLHGEIDSLSDRIAELVASANIGRREAEIIRNLLQQ
uniref:Uncharacterized protein n=1 Tax=Kalanchoe fedtschenkoi TaxID=63787 RepID=A0A7N1A0K8_KALFE